jgi:multidrug efflux system membrane fusion protein
MKQSVLALSLAVMLAGCHERPAYVKPIVPVTLATVESRATGGTVRYSATVKPDVEVQVAFKVSGYVEDLLRVNDDRGRQRDLQEGDRVARGAALARVRASDYDQRLAQVKSGLAEAQAMHESARLDFERATRLFERKSLTKPELDAAKARLDASAAKVEGARAALGETQIMRDDTVLRSPIQGVVLKRHVERGTLVAPGQPAFTVADTSAVKLSFGVPDVFVKRLAIGRPQRVTFDALQGQPFDGRITSIAPAPDPVSRVYEVEVTIPNPQAQIQVGFIATLYFADAPGAAVPAVPLDAIVKLPDKDAEYGVFVLARDGDKDVARYRPVTLGDTLGNMVVVTGGLTVGEKVIVRGATIVTDGEPVRPLA